MALEGGGEKPDAMMVLRVGPLQQARSDLQALPLRPILSQSYMTCFLVNPIATLGNYPKRVPRKQNPKLTPPCDCL